MRYLATFLFVLQVGFGGGIRGPLQSFAPAAITATIINDGKYNAFPGLVRLPSGRLVVIYRAGTNHSAANDGVLKYQTSTDSGATWSSAGSVYTPGVMNHDARDPEVILLANGTLLVSFFEAISGALQNVFVITGTIGGGDALSWSAPVAVTTFVADFTNYNATSSKPIQLGTGKILLPVYGKNTGDSSDSAAIVSSTDNGATWGSFTLTASNPVTNGWTEAGGVVLGNTVILLVRHDTGTGLGYDLVQSSDNGATWTTPVQVIAQTDLLGRPSLALSGLHDLFLITRETGNLPGYATSTTAGTSWPALTTYVLSGDPRYEYASVIRLPDSSMGAVIGKETGGAQTNSYLTYQNFTQSP